MCVCVCGPPSWEVLQHFPGCALLRLDTDELSADDIVNYAEKFGEVTAFDYAPEVWPDGAIVAQIEFSSVEEEAAFRAVPVHKIQNDTGECFLTICVDTSLRVDGMDETCMALTIDELGLGLIARD